MYYGYIARFCQEQHQLQKVLLELLGTTAARVLTCYLNLSLSDDGPMPYAGHGEHVAFTLNNGTTYTAVVGKRRNIPTLVLAAYYPKPGYGPGGGFRYQAQLASSLGSDRCVQIDTRSALIGQMNRLYEA